MNYIGATPYPHQEDIYALSKENKNLALLWEMGTGKTFGLINILRGLYSRQGRVMKTLIFSPIVTLYNWKDEIKKYSKIDQNDIVVIDKSGQQRIKLFNKAVGDSTYKIVIVNWEALITKEFFDLLLHWQPEIIVGDEVHYIKSHKSIRSKRAVQLADECKIRGGHKYILTGTLSLNGIQDVFMPFRFLDGGVLFGNSYYAFQYHYMKDENANWSSKPGHFPKYVTRDEKVPEATKKIRSVSTIITKEECLKDLPPLVEMVRKVPLSPEQSKLYNQMKKEFITFIENQREGGKTEAVVAQLALTKALRLQQIISGFVKTDDGNTIQIKKNPRMDHTREILTEITPSNKCIIWCCFKYDYEQLGRLCDELKIKYQYLTGAMSLQKKRDAMDEFRREEDCRVIIANRKAGGIGINLVEASYSIIYSRNFSLGDELQSAARNYRGGSQIHNKITRVNLCATDTLDEEVLKRLQLKQNIAEKILDIIK